MKIKTKLIIGRWLIPLDNARANALLGFKEPPSGYT